MRRLAGVKRQYFSFAEKVYMKILLIGASGTIGRRLVTALSPRHQVVTAGRNSGELRVDISDAASIERMFLQAENLDACICAAVSGPLDDFQTINAEALMVHIRGKLLGQVNLVLIGQHYLNNNGSFTLTSGIFADDPYRQTAGGALACGALHSFVHAASLELKRGLRVNVVSPGLVEDSAEAYGPLFPGLNPVPVPRLINAYLKSAEGLINGQTLRVYE